MKIAGELDERISEMGLGERSRFEQRVRRLTASSTSQPDFSGFHEVFRDHAGAEPTPEGDVRRAFYLSYNDANCAYLTNDEIFGRLDAGIDVVSATFVTPYPPGFPVLVPGQVSSREILTFIRDLDTPEIHGYQPISATGCTPRRRLRCAGRRTRRSPTGIVGSSPNRQNRCWSPISSSRLL